jgi:hypothetical protein
MEEGAMADNPHEADPHEADPQEGDPLEGGPLEGGPLEGGCQCGAVRYRVSAAASEIYHCHCSLCRKLHGAVFATWAVVPRGGLEVIEGALATFESSPGVRRRFCGGCGCHLFCEIDSDPNFDWFTPATLDGGAHPGHGSEREQHIFVGSKVQWWEIRDGLKQYQDYPPAYGGS